MHALLLCLATATAVPSPQLSFGGPSSGAAPTTTTEAPINTRLGLLADSLGLDPTAAQSSIPGRELGSSSAFTQQSSSSSSSSAFTDGQAAGRIPQGNEFENQFSSNTLGSNAGQQCCCVPVSEQCQDPLGDDLVGGGFIDPRLKPKKPAVATRIISRQPAAPKSDIAIRIVNRPQANPNAQLSGCPVGQKSCCYDASIQLSVFGITCINPQVAQQSVGWTQGCSRENVREVPGVKTCGTRTFPRPVSGLQHGESSPGEFPWTCLLLNQNNDFIGSCAIIPNDSTNDNGRGTRKVITAAHKLKKLQQSDLLKVRVGEWDASGFNPPETADHAEYTVMRILKHPQFSAGRLDNDIAILYTDRDINLNNNHINTACLPSCDNQFDYQFANRTGVRCWVAGWGKDEIDGSFQFKQHKVDLPLVEDGSCQAKLKVALNGQKRGVGDRFSLSPSEVCAGAEVGKDACTGDGGSPLVCQANSGRWTVVGLVTWGVGCASDVPGVYAKVSHFINWINAN